MALLGSLRGLLYSNSTELKDRLTIFFQSLNLLTAEDKLKNPTLCLLAMAVAPHTGNISLLLFKRGGGNFLNYIKL